MVIYRRSRICSILWHTKNAYGTENLRVLTGTVLMWCEGSQHKRASLGKQTIPAAGEKGEPQMEMVRRCRLKHRCLFTLGLLSVSPGSKVERFLHVPHTRTLLDSAQQTPILSPHHIAFGQSVPEDKNSSFCSCLLWEGGVHTQ